MSDNKTAIKNTGFQSAQSTEELTNKPNLEQEADMIAEMTMDVSEDMQAPMEAAKSDKLPKKKHGTKPSQDEKESAAPLSGEPVIRSIPLPPADPSRKTIIEMTDVIKKFYIGTPNELTILKGINIRVYDGEFISIVGASGSGKSTLMNIIGALDKPTSGEYILGGDNVKSLNDTKLSDIRNRRIGFVFQTFNLIPRTNALKNVELPMLYGGVSAGKRAAKAKELLELVEMSDRLKHLPSELSGGQKQRVAIARAMANNPDIILADEPTGALDTETGRLVMDLFHMLHREQGKTIVLITHNPELALETERILTISDGMIIEEKVNEPNSGGSQHESA